MANYVHMSVLILPKIAVLFYMGYVNGKCTLIIFDKHANYKHEFWNRYFGAKGDYISTVGLSEETVRNYIHVQKLYDKWRISWV